MEGSYLQRLADRTRGEGGGALRRPVQRSVFSPSPNMTAMPKGGQPQDPSLGDATRNLIQNQMANYYQQQGGGHQQALGQWLQNGLGQSYPGDTIDQGFLNQGTIQQQAGQIAAQQVAGSGGQNVPRPSPHDYALFNKPGGDADLSNWVTAAQQAGQLQTMPWSSAQQGAAGQGSPNYQAALQQYQQALAPRSIVSSYTNNQMGAPRGQALGDLLAALAKSR